MNLFLCFSAGGMDVPWFLHLLRLVMLSTPAGDKLRFKGQLYTPAAPDGGILRDRVQKNISTQCAYEWREMNNKEAHS